MTYAERVAKREAEIEGLARERIRSATQVMTYAERVAKREAEIEGLKEALEILSA